MAKRTKILWNPKAIKEEAQNSKAAPNAMVSTGSQTVVERTEQSTQSETCHPHWPEEEDVRLDPNYFPSSGSASWTNVEHFTEGEE